MLHLLSTPSVALVSVLSAAPLSAQAPLTVASCTLVHFGEPSGALFGSLQTLARSDELADMAIYLRAVDRTPEQYANSMRIPNIRRDSAWALIVADASGIAHCLAQGKEVPTKADILRAFEEAGAKTPVRVLRDFLKTRPDHLGARMDLLSLLRRNAEDRTKCALQLDVDRPSDLIRQGDAAGYFQMNTWSVAIDISHLEGKELEPEQDIRIWGPYAQEFQTLFASGDWRIVTPSWFYDQIPLEACSPTMVKFYRSNLARIEEHIENWPSHVSLWKTYGWVATIAKRGNAKALMDRMIPTPNTHFHAGVTQPNSILTAEEGAKGNWGLVADTLWHEWPISRVRLYNYYVFSSSETPDSAATKTMQQMVWHETIKPLLDALIRTNRTSDAETVVLNSARYRTYRDFQRMAAEVARSCGRQDLQARWLVLQIPENNEPDMDVLNARLILNAQLNPNLHLINRGESDGPKIQALLNEDRIIDWGISDEQTGVFPPSLSELLPKREGWPEDEIHWGLFHKNRMLADGAGIPTADALRKVVEENSIETPASILRRFVATHPTHLEAKEHLLGELKRLAEHSTQQKIGSAAGRDASLLLSDEDDQAIWGEYARLYRQALPIFVEEGRSFYWTEGACQSNLFIHSKTMKGLAISLLPRVEACLMRQPTDTFLWDVWISLSELDGLKQFKHIKEMLVLSPMDSPLNLPPLNSRRSLMNIYKAKSNWQGIIDVQEWRWEETLNTYTSAALNMSIWNDMRHLLEAYLRLEKTNDANGMINVWSQSTAWEGFKPLAAEVAERCGKEALAEQWKRM